MGSLLEKDLPVLRTKRSSSWSRSVSGRVGIGRS